MSRTMTAEQALSSGAKALIRAAVCWLSYQNRPRIKTALTRQSARNDPGNPSIALPPIDWTVPRTVRPLLPFDLPGSAIASDAHDKNQRVPGRIDAHRVRVPTIARDRMIMRLVAASAPAVLRAEARIYVPAALANVDESLSPGLISVRMRRHFGGRQRMIAGPPAVAMRASRSRRARRRAAGPAGRGGGLDEASGQIRRRDVAGAIAARHGLPVAQGE